MYLIVKLFNLIYLLVISVDCQLDKVNGDIEVFNTSIYSTLGQIRNGAIAPHEMFPYIVSIQTYSMGQHICGGTVISPFHVLTAAHCLYTKPMESQFKANELQIRIGPSNLLSPATVSARVKGIKIHEDYKKRLIDNDIAILKVDRALTTTETDIPCLSNSFIFPASVSGPCISAGWGRLGPDPIRIQLSNTNNISHVPVNVTSTQNESSHSNIIKSQKYLRFTLLPLQNVDECAKDYSMADITDRVLCAGQRNSNTDTCKGDSGGPLICDGKIEGIVSFGDGCDNPEHLGVYTRVYNHLHWIRTNIDSGLGSMYSSALLMFVSILCMFIL